MWTDESVLQVQDLFGEHCDTAVAAWARWWNHWGDCRDLSCGCVVKEMHSPFVRCREELDDRRRLVELLTCMHDQPHCSASERNLEYFLVLQRLDGLLFVDLHELWPCDGYFESPMPMNLQLTKTFVR